MLTVDECRQLLDDPDLTDEEIAQFLDDLRTFLSQFLDDFFRDEPDSTEV